MATDLPLDEITLSDVFIAQDEAEASGLEWAVEMFARHPGHAPDMLTNRARQLREAVARRKAAAADDH